MADPRIERTRSHVLETARRLLESPEPTLNFTILAAEAKVSRRTLYTHWGTIERVISETLVARPAIASFDSEPSPRGRLELFLFELRDRIHEPVARAGIAALVSTSGRNEDAALQLPQLAESARASFAELVAPIGIDDFVALVGPLFLNEFVLHGPASDALIARLVAHGASILDLDDTR